MDLRKPGSWSMHDRIEHSQKNYRKMIESSSHEVFIQMFIALSKLSQNVPDTFPVNIDNFNFTNFEFLGTLPLFNPNPQRPHIASGEYTDATIHFKFDIRKTVGLKELINFDIICNTNRIKNQCTCPWNLLHKGCQCGAITPYKPIL